VNGHLAAESNLAFVGDGLHSFRSTVSMPAHAEALLDDALRFSRSMPALIFMDGLLQRIPNQAFMNRDGLHSAFCFFVAGKIGCHFLDSTR